MKSVVTKSQISAFKAANKKLKSINPKIQPIKKQVVTKSVIMMINQNKRMTNMP
jgi:hypothetical protein